MTISTFYNWEYIRMIAQTLCILCMQYVCSIYCIFFYDSNLFTRTIKQFHFRKKFNLKNKNSLVLMFILILYFFIYSCSVSLYYGKSVIPMIYVDIHLKKRKYNFPRIHYDFKWKNPLFQHRVISFVIIEYIHTYVICISIFFKLHYYWNFSVYLFYSKGFKDVE